VNNALEPTSDFPSEYERQEMQIKTFSSDTLPILEKEMNIWLLQKKMVQECIPETHIISLSEYHEDYYMAYITYFPLKKLNVPKQTKIKGTKSTPVTNKGKTKKDIVLYIYKKIKEGGMERKDTYEIIFKKLKKRGVNVELPRIRSIISEYEQEQNEI